MKIGFLGIGKIGRCMAWNSLKAEKNEILFYARRPEIIDEMERAGATRAGSAGSLISESEICVIALADEEQLKECLWRDGELLPEITKGKIFLVCATLGQTCVEMFSAKCERRGAVAVDAPVSGGVEKAASGMLTMFLAGEESACETAKKIAEPFTAKVYTVGKRAGQAQQLKLINQLLVGIHMLAAAEAFSIAKRMRLDLKTVYEAVTHSAGSSTVFENRFPCLMREDYTTKASVRIIRKDIGLAMREFQSPGWEALMLKQADKLFGLAEWRGFTDEDMCAVAKIYENTKESK